MFLTTRGTSLCLMANLGHWQKRITCFFLSLHPNLFLVQSRSLCGRHVSTSFWILFGRFLLVPLRFASEVWPRTGLGEPRSTSNANTPASSWPLKQGRKSVQNMAAMEGPRQYYIFDILFVILRLHTNKRRSCSSTLSGHPSSCCIRVAEAQSFGFNETL